MSIPSWQLNMEIRVMLYLLIHKTGRRGSRYLLLAAAIFLFSRESKGQYDLNIDLAKKYQIMDGFGASDAWRFQFVGENWPEEKRERISTLLFSRETDRKGNPEGIGLSIWRFYVGSGSAEQGDDSGIQNAWRRSECFINEQGEYDWNKQQGQQWFLRRARQHGVEKFLAFTIAAPVFWSINGKGYSIKGDNRFNLKPDRYDDYAAFLTRVMQHFKEEENIVFDYISPFNEPQWDWSKQSQEGTAATNGELYLFMKYLSEELKDSGLPTQIVPGESGDLRFLYSENGNEAQGDQIKAFFARNSPLYIGDFPHMAPIISGHSYFSTWPVSTLVDVRRRLASGLKEVDGLKFWQTEFCILEKSSEIGGGRPRDLGMNTALYVARVIHADITIANAASWQWWTALTQHDYKDGLIYIDSGNEQNRFDMESTKYDGEIHESKLLWSFGNFSRFVRPGMVRVEAALTPALDLEQQGTDLMVSAFHNQEKNEIALVLINHSRENRKVNLTNSGIQLSGSYTTSEKGNLEYAKVKKNKIEIPPRAVVTLVGQRVE